MTRLNSPEMEYILDERKGNASTVFSGEGKAIFVMDENRDFYASKFQQVGRFHHSSLAGGEPVAAAG